MSYAAPGGGKTETVIVEGDAAAFTSALTRLFVELEVTFAETTHQVRADVETHRFGDLELLRTSIASGVFTASRSGELLAKSVSNSFFVGCVFSGSICLSQEGRVIRLETSDIALLDSSQEYSVAINGPVDLLWIRIPRFRLEGRLAVPAEVTAQRVDGRYGPGRLASSLMQATFDEAARVSHSHAQRVANVLLDMLALSVDVHERTDNLRSSGVLRRVQNHIEANLGDPQMSLKSIADRHAISVRYLNKLFQREGISTARWIRLRRLERCRRDLESAAADGRAISDIAYTHGFSDISSFNRGFKTHFGVSPRSLRRR